MKRKIKVYWRGVLQEMFDDRVAAIKYVTERSGVSYATAVSFRGWQVV